MEGRTSRVLFFLLFAALHPGWQGVTQDGEAKPILGIDNGGHYATIREILVTPDGSQVISMGMDKTVRIWDSSKGSLLKTLRREIGPGFAGTLYSGAVSPDGRFLAIGGRDLAVEAGSAASIRIIDLTAESIVAVLPGHEGTITALDFSPDGRCLASGSVDNSVRLWNVATLLNLPAGTTEPATLTDHLVLEQHTGAVYALAFSNGGKRLMSASADSKVVLWDTASFLALLGADGKASAGRVARSAICEKHRSPIFAADASPDGRFVVSGDLSGQLLLWNGDTGEFLAELDRSPVQVSAVEFSPDGTSVFASSMGIGADRQIEGRAGVYSVSPPQLKKALPLEGNLVSACAWDGKNNRLALSEGAGNAIQIWDPGGQSPEIHLRSLGRAITDVGFGDGTKGIKVAFGFLDEGKFDLDEQGLEYVFDFDNLQLSRIDRETDYARTFHPERSSEVKETGENSILLDRRHEIVLSERNNVYRGHSFTESGKLLVAHDFGVSLYSPDGSKIRDLSGHEAAVRAVASSPGDLYAVSGGEDRTLRLWNLETGELLVSLFVADPGSNDWVCWSPDGYYATLGNGGNYVGWHQNKGGDHLASFFRADRVFDKLYRPDVIRRIILERKSSSEIVARIQSELDLKKAAESAPLVEFSGITPGLATTKTQVFKVKAIPKGRDIQEVRLFHQGKRLDPDGPPTEEGDAIVVPFQITLVDGTNKLEAVAVNVDDVGSEPEAITLDYAGEKANARLHVLVVGLNNYRNEAYNLQYCRSDAEALVGGLRKSSSGLFRETNVVEVYDGDATRPSIESAFAKISAAAVPEDVFIFFYAGHGVMGETTSGDTIQFHLIPHDVTQMYGNPAILEEKAVSAESLKKLCTSVKATKQLLLIDACQSGGIVESFDVRAVPQEQAIAKLAKSIGTTILTATAKERFAREAADLGHGFFTYSIIRALQGKGDINEDGYITVMEVSAWVDKDLPKLSFEHTKIEQFPQLYFQGNDFPISIVQSN